ncbi:FecR family protein [Sphingobacterium sp. E70]|uniref:FecR family protein n=1 Tax=Sphingobacterium sp. E70 TaxID=2853439 RepID=UPI00211C55DB|nr:FecR family protein [Sphingobacterium sp. E70]ULT25285.1 FecR family protein [Sphingobacterium sp. E70]
MSAGVSLQYDSAQAVYSLSQPQAQAQNIYHTIETPNGRRYHLTLSDGTQIWLNAGSKLRFPIAFNGALREVFLTGEAYFEVSKTHSSPFWSISTTMTARLKSWERILTFPPIPKTMVL